MLAVVITVFLGLHGHPVRSVSLTRFPVSDYDRCMTHGRRVVERVVAGAKRSHRSINITLDCEEQATSES